MLTTYIQTAMQHARLTSLPESGLFFGEIPETPGVWATGPTEPTCLHELQEVLEDWIELTLVRGWELPVIDGVDINVRLEVVG